LKVVLIKESRDSLVQRMNVEDECTYDGYGRAICVDESSDDVESREVLMMYERFELFERLRRKCGRYDVGDCRDTVSNVWRTYFARL
jgi:hypothetical protein